MQTLHQINFLFFSVNFFLGYQNFNNAHKETSFPTKAKMCFEAAQNPQLTQRDSKSLICWMLLCSLGGNTGVSKKLSLTPGESKTAHLLWVTVLSSRQTIWAASTQRQPYLSTTKLTGMTPPERL